MISTCLIPTMKQDGGGVMVWGCFAGDTVSVSILSSSVQGLCYFSHLNLFFLLASLRYGFFIATRPRRPASRSRLFTVDVETGVLRVLFNEAAS